jgi:patatin-related protein
MPVSGSPGAAVAETGAAKSAGQSEDDNEAKYFDRQDIRLAVVMNGGVSLAIWISGVTLELNHLVLSSRGYGSSWPAYRQLLDLLQAKARVDVIAGTSAGGINGIFLGLGLVRERDLQRMRDLWRDNGGLENLLQDALHKNPPSLLRGDDYFLPVIRGALADVIGPAGDLPPRDAASASEKTASNLELIITGTLWAGRTSSFTDDIGMRMTEVDYDALFRFARHGAAEDGGGDGETDEFTADAVLEKLATAGRCTSSFPGAFEPHWVSVTGSAGATGDGWASAAGRANFSESQYLVDGGILLNTPIRPALEAVYQQTADLQVRRILAYIAPDPGEPAPSPAPQEAGGNPPVPQADEVLLGVLTRLRSTDSISRELTEIRQTNATVRSRRRARDRLATALTEAKVAEPLSAAAWPGYVKTRTEYGARLISQLLADGQTASSTGAAAQTDSARQWSVTELVTLLQGKDLPFVPHGDLESAVGKSGSSWDWGQTTVQRLGDMAVDVLKRAVWLAEMGSPARDEIVHCRKALSKNLAEIRADRRDRDQFWLTAPGGAQHALRPMPDRGSQPAAADISQLDKWLTDALAAWRERWDSAADRERLYDQALAIAKSLHSRADAIGKVAKAPIGPQQAALDPDHSEQEQLDALYNYLLVPCPPAEEMTAAEVLRRMLRLDVVQLSFTGASPQVEQGVELIKVSSDAERLTGIQLHHFGAFYRPSWRVNDWIQGRMDGAAQIVRMLLSPERLRQICFTAQPAGPGVNAQDARERLVELIHAIAAPAGHPDSDWLEQQWQQHAAACGDEVERVVAATEPAPANRTAPALSSAAPGDTGFGIGGQAMQACATAIALPLQLDALREDLPALAVAIRGEGEDTPAASRTWLASYDAAVKQLRSQDQSLPAGALWSLWDEARPIGKETITGEARSGSDTFAQTVSHAATVAASTFGSPSKITSKVNIKAVGSVLSAFRGYSLMVWAIVTFLTSNSRFAVHAVELALAAGGVLIAAAILVPGMPLALILAGVAVLLAGITAAALLTGESRKVGYRLIGAVLLAAAALGGYLWWDWSRNGPAMTWGLLIKAGVTVLVVLLGWWVARVSPRRRRHTE